MQTIPTGGPSYGADRAEALQQNTNTINKLSEKMETIAKRPTYVNMHIDRVVTNEDAVQAAAKVGDALSMGWRVEQFKPAMY